MPVSDRTLVQRVACVQRGDRLLQPCWLPAECALRALRPLRALGGRCFACRATAPQYRASAHATPRHTPHHATGPQTFVLYVRAELENIATLSLVKGVHYCIDVKVRAPPRAAARRCRVQQLACCPEPAAAGRSLAHAAPLASQLRPRSWSRHDARPPPSPPPRRRARARSSATACTCRRPRRMTSRAAKAPPTCEGGGQHWGRAWGRAGSVAAQLPAAAPACAALHRPRALPSRLAWHLRTNPSAPRRHPSFPPGHSL